MSAEKGGGLTHKDLFNQLSKIRKEDKKLVKEVIGAIENLNKITKDCKKKPFYHWDNIRGIVIVLTIMAVFISICVGKEITIKVGGLDFSREAGV